MKKIYAHMMNYKLHTRLMIYFSTMVIVAMLLVAGISYIASYRIVEELAYSFSNQSAQSVADNLNDIFNEAENLSGLVENNSIFQSILNAEMPEDIRDRYATELKYDFELYQLAGYTINEFGGLYVLGDNGFNFKSHNVAFQETDFRKEEWYRRIHEADGVVWFGPKVYSRTVKAIDRSYAAMGCPVINKANGNRIGVVLVEIEADSIEYIIREFGNIENGVIQVLDGENTILFQKNGTGNDSGEAKSHKDRNRNHSVFYYTETMDNGWTVESYIPKAILLGRIINLGIWLGLVIFLMILLAVKVTSVISGTVTNPINKLIDLMEQAEQKEFAVQMHVKYKDELAVLGNKFNNMMDFTRHLIAVNNKEQENLREAELKTLQMQINPHFLYNTLETVIWLIRSKENEKAISVITSLSKFFRIGLSRGRNIIMLREELEHVREYVKIQNTRYRDKINFSIHLTENTMLDCPIPKLTLQPLVENAIYHGIQEKPEGGHVLIEIAREAQDRIRITVADDGIGMTPAQLERLQTGLKEMGEVGFGMYNTNQRLCNYFGEESALKIESRFGEGTRVSFSINDSRREGKVYD